MSPLVIRTAEARDLQQLLDLTAEDAIRAFDEPTTPTDRPLEAAFSKSCLPDARA